MQLLEEINLLFEKIPGIKKLSKKCLSTERWNGNVILMLLDAAITSVGVNYFQVVIPKVKAFKREFVDSKKISSLRDLEKINFEAAISFWKNKRSWQILKEIAQYLPTLALNDRAALRIWAKNSSLQGWKKDPIGKIKGIGLVTYQYLRMMGGVDTVMPDKIVKRVINEILLKSGEKPINDDIEFIKKVEEIASLTGYGPTELCFITWFINSPEKIKEMP